MEWLLNKQNKMPLYLQLKDLAKYHISTGVLQDKQQLPTVHGLAKKLGVNFETVRKAYKELEREGLVSSQRGRGTFVNGHKVSQPFADGDLNHRSGLTESLQRTVIELLRIGASAEELKALIDELSRESTRGIVLFAECNPLQTQEISNILKTCLSSPVRPVLLKDLKEEVAKLSRAGHPPTAVVTTGFHINEVRNQLADQPLKLEFVVTNMSPETRRALEAFDKTSRFGFVCRDSESFFYKEVLKSELGMKTEITCCTLAEKAKLTALLKTADALLVSPPVYEAIKKLAPRKLAVFNVFDRVDPMSLRMVKDSIESVGG